MFGQTTKQEFGDAGPVLLRPASFEDVPALLRLIEAAVEHGCRDHYGPSQRRAVFLTYAETLFLDVLQAFQTLVAEAPPTANGAGALVGVAQVDPQVGRLRALFIAPRLQGHGAGRFLLAAAERRARAYGVRALEGAMALNAVPFYTRCGFLRRPGPDHLVRGGIVVPIVTMQKALDVVD